MVRSQFDEIIKQINDSHPDLSDIIFTSGKSIQAEVYGRLTPVRTRPELGVLVPFQVEAMTMVMMGSNLQLYKNQLFTGSCDLSYELLAQARFRVNIFAQKGTLAIVMRKLSMEVPTMAQLSLPKIFNDMAMINASVKSSLKQMIDRIKSEQGKKIRLFRFKRTFENRSPLFALRKDIPHARAEAALEPPSRAGERKGRESFSGPGQIALFKY